MWNQLRDTHRERQEPEPRNMRRYQGPFLIQLILVEMNLIASLTTVFMSRLIHAFFACLLLF